MNQATWQQRYQLDQHFLQQYEILDAIGKGSMGEVVRARQVSVGRQVAIKFLLPKFYQDRESIQRFRSEASILARLNHPNVVQLLTFQEHVPVPYLVLEYVEGVSLRKLIGNKGPMPAWSALKVLIQILQGLKQAHEAKIIHRDLKSENILIAPGGVAKIVDFGLAKLTEGKGNQTDSGVILGTPEYMSPEQIRGEPLDGRTDLYSAGVILFEMLTGAVPFRNPQVTALLLDHLETPPPLVHQVCPELPAELGELVSHALAKDVFSRFRSAEAFLLAVEGAARSLKRQDLLDSRANIRPAAGATQVLAPPEAAPGRGGQTHHQPQPAPRPVSPRARGPASQVSQVSEAPTEEAPAGRNPFLPVVLLTLLLCSAGLAYRLGTRPGRNESEVRQEAVSEHKLAELAKLQERLLDEGFADPTQGLFLTREMAAFLEEPSCAGSAQKALCEVLESGPSDEMILAAGLPMVRKGVPASFLPLLSVFPRRPPEIREEILDALHQGATVTRAGARFVKDEELAGQVCEKLLEILQEPFGGRFQVPERVRLIRLYSHFAHTQALQEKMVELVEQTRFDRPSFASPEEFTALGATARTPPFESLRKLLQRRYLHKGNPDRVVLPEEAQAAMEASLR